MYSTTQHQRYSSPRQRLKSWRLFVLTGLLYGMSLSVCGQTVSISGPQCVIAGPVYLYNINGQWQPGSKVRVCLTGGRLVDSASTCAGGSGILSFVRVSWDSNAQNSGTIAVTTSLGNCSFSVKMSKSLAGGVMDSGMAHQTVDTGTIPANLVASQPTGGACQPAYGFQWQQSPDNVIWKNIEGAGDAQLAFLRPLPQTTYFRRIVKDTAAQILAYSNVAVIFVNTPMPTPTNLQIHQP